VELDAARVGALHSGSVIMHVNKVHSVTLIWVFGLGDDGIMAFTDFGIENLMELIRIHKENPELLKR